MAKSDRLLRAVLERPDDRSVVEVYGDALQARGDPRGTLVSVQRQRELARDEAQRRALKVKEQQLLEEHRAELYGPLAKLDDFTAAWRLGFLRELHVDVGGDVGPLAEALHRDAFALLERLVVKVDATSDLDALAGALPASLHHLTLAASEGPWEGVLEGLPPLRSVDLWGGADLDFAGLKLSRLERLWLTCGYDHLTAAVAPRLERLTLGDGFTVQHVERVPPGLKLLRLFGEAWTDVPLPKGLRCIHELEPATTTLADDEFGVGTVTRGNFGTAGERALLLTSATAPQLDAVFEPLSAEAGPYELRAAPVTMWGRALLAVEVRVVRPRERLLGELAAALGDGVEIVASRTNRTAMVRDSAGKELAKGHYRQREDVWRAGLDHALGFDPGRTYDTVCELLDAEAPRRADGDAATSLRGEWPCATPLPALESPAVGNVDEAQLEAWWIEAGLAR